MYSEKEQKMNKTELEKALSQYHDYGSAKEIWEEPENVLSWCFRNELGHDNSKKVIANASLSNAFVRALTLFKKSDEISVGQLLRAHYTLELNDIDHEKHKLPDSL